MPRTANSKTLSDGWKKLHKFKLWDLDKKVVKSKKMLGRILKKHKNPVICWSGGKDSTVVLHLVKKLDSSIPVIHVNTGVNFPETNDFVKYLTKLWKLNIKIVKPATGETFWDATEKYGWPIFGKSIASNVGRAIRTGNIRPQLSQMEKILVENNVRLSARCCDFVHEKPTKRAEYEYKADLKIIGIRALESRMRTRIWVDYGDYYYVKRYYGRNKGIWKLNPIAIWTEKDIWDYHRRHSIPHCKLYDMGYPRNGCWTCAMGIRNGQLERLKQGHPILYKYLLEKTNMSLELKKAKNALMKYGSKFSSQINKL